MRAPPVRANVLVLMLALAARCAPPADHPDLSRPPDLRPPADLTESLAQMIQAGQAHVMTRGCAMCHQSMSAGAGVLSGNDAPVPGTMIYPPNLSPDPDTGLGFWTDAEIMRAMRHGLDIEGRAMCWVMPHWNMSDQEATEIVAYLRSLPPVRHDVPYGVCPPRNGADAGAGP